jgi:phage gpG-like protein
LSYPIPNIPEFVDRLKRDLQSDAEKWGLDFIRGNFAREGFTDEAHSPWPARKTSMGYKLLRVTGNLMRSTHVASSSIKRVEFENDAPYATIHNEGGVIRVPVTDAMRKYFWYMHKATGAPHWKWMALTKKKVMTITIPQRQFMGDSAKFGRVWTEHVARTIEQRFKQHLNVK